MVPAGGVEQRIPPPAAIILQPGTMPRTDTTGGEAAGKEEITCRN